MSISLYKTKKNVKLEKHDILKHAILYGVS